MTEHQLDPDDAADEAEERAHMAGLAVPDLLVHADYELHDGATFRPACDELDSRGVPLPDTKPAPPSTPEQRRQWAHERLSDSGFCVLPPGSLDNWVPGPGDIDLRAAAAELASAEQLTVRADAGDEIARTELERRRTLADTD